MATQNPALDYLLNDIDKAISSFERGAKANRSWAFRFHIFIATLAIGSTILLGLNLEGNVRGFPLKVIARIAALLFGGGISLLSSWNLFFNFRDLWVNYAMTKEELRRLKFEIEFTGRMQAITAETLEQFKNKYHKILAETDGKWEKIRDEKKT